MSTWLNILQTNIALLSFSTGQTIPRLTAPLLVRSQIGIFLLIPLQILFMILTSIPLLFLELALGQYSSKATIKVWDLCPIFRGIGIGSFLTFLIYQTYCSFLASCTLCFAFLSLTKTQQWQSCSNSWNKVNCFNLQDNLTRHEECFGRFSRKECDEMQWQSSIEQFYLYRILNIDDRMSEAGTPQKELLVSACITTAIIFFVNYGGQKFMEKILIVLLILPSLQLLLLLFNPLANSYGSFIYYLFTTNNKSNLNRFDFWRSLTESSLSSTGLGFGAYLTLGKQFSFRTPIHFRAIAICLFSNFLTILYSVAIQNFVISVCLQNKILLEDSTKLEQNLAIPEALFFLNSSKFWIVMWLSSSYLLALRHLIVAMFINTQVLFNTFPKFQNYSSFCLFFFCVVIYSQEIFLSTRIGYFIVNTSEKIINKFNLPFLNVSFLLGVVYFYGLRQLRDDIQFMLGIKVSTFWNLLYILNPIFLSLVFGYNLWSYYQSESPTSWISIYENTLLWLPPGIVVLYSLTFTLISSFQQNWNFFSAGEDWNPADKSLRISRKMFKIYNIAQEFLYHQERFMPEKTQATF